MAEPPFQAPPFDPVDPRADPPASTTRPMLWRVAMRLYTDHAESDAVDEGSRRCRTCADPWPCFPRRLAERGLLAASS